MSSCCQSFVLLYSFYHMYSLACSPNIHNTDSNFSMFATQFCSFPFKIRRDFVWFGVRQVPLARYLSTWKGKIVERDAEMSAACVTVMGLSLTAEGGPEGREQGPRPFRLELDWIKALRVT
jgi:hypothetical protein